MEDPSETRTGKSVRVDDPVYPERVRVMVLAKPEASLTLKTKALEEDFAIPAAFSPVMVMVKFEFPVASVEPVI